MDTKRPLLLDLFCGAGGAGMGYYRAGFDVLGVDIAPQPRYPFAFIQADALDFPAWLIASGDIHQFAAVHASPPCQRYSNLKSLTRRAYADLLAETRDLLIASGRTWVLENVYTAPMAQGVMLCGTALGMNVRRHRLFDSSHLLYPPGPCRHNPDNINVYGNDAWCYRPAPEHWQKRTNKGQSRVPLAAARVAFETHWMTRHGMAECIPPAYTEWIGRQLIAALANTTTAA